MKCFKSWEVIKSRELTSTFGWKPKNIHKKCFQRRLSQLQRNSHCPHSPKIVESKNVGIFPRQLDWFNTSTFSQVGSIPPPELRGDGHNILIYCSSQSTELEPSSTECNHCNCYRSLKQVHERVLIQLNLIALSMNIFGHWSKNKLPKRTPGESFC